MYVKLVTNIKSMVAISKLVCNTIVRTDVENLLCDLAVFKHFKFGI